MILSEMTQIYKEKYCAYLYIGLIYIQNLKKKSEVKLRVAENTLVIDKSGEELGNGNTSKLPVVT